MIVPARLARSVSLQLILIALAALLGSDHAHRAFGDEAADVESVTIRHQLEPGQTLRYRVTHVAKTKTRMNGSEEIANVHTTSTRAWMVGDADDQEMTFDHIVESVAMTQQSGDADEIRWDSTSGEEPPDVFSVVASQIASPLATVTINKQGQEVRREDHGGTKASLGMGKLVLAVPATPVKIGGSWAVPSEIQVRTPESEVKTIKVRQLFTLKKVSAGVATIAIKSEPLTPIDDESVRAQVVQQLSNGTMRFDLDNGYMISKQLDWDETVVGFQGANSMMEYRAKMTEELLPEGPVQTASQSSKTQR
ncbi:MAG: hypothetical protein AAGC97_09925 [Planctomycetota bacterium]